MKCITLKVVLMALFISTSCLNICGQADITPPSPTAYEISKYGQAATGSYTGTNTVSIPLQAFSTGRIQVPISLTYSSNGIKVDQLSSNVGLAWSLNAGGVISRIIRDVADEKSTQVFPRTAWENSGLMDPTVLDYFYVAGLDYPGNENDSEPDLFSFNFAGYSGQFVFDEDDNIVLLTNNTDLRVLRVGSSQTNFNFKIISPDGISYHFEQQESSRMRAEGNGHTIPGPENTTAWYLTKIIHPLGDEVYFDYATTSYNYIVANAQTYTVNVSPFTNCSDGNGGTVPTSTSPVIGNRLHIVGKRLVRIRGNSPTYGSIDIEYNEGHGAVNGYKMVTDILIKDGNGNGVEDLHFNYLRTANQRVFLEDVTSSNPSHTHKFDYINPSDFPARLDKGQDHWGFYNGENNLYYFPQPSTLEDNLIPQFSTITLGANKSPDDNFAENGLLKRVHYPTGGFTEFEYDGNSYMGTAVITPPTKNVNLSVNTDSYNNGKKEDVITLTGIQENQDVYVGHSVFFNTNNGTGCDPANNLGKSRIIISVIDLTNPNITNLLYSNHTSGPQYYGNFYVLKEEDYDPGNPVNLYLSLTANHDYEVKLSADWFCTDGAAGFTYFEGTSTTISEEKLSGGLRLAKIKNYESASHLASQTKIYYGSQADPTIPSSNKPPTPYYISNITQRLACPIPCDYVDVRYKVLNTNSVRNLYDTQTGTMSYKYVTVSEGGDNFENGGIEYEYVVKPGGQGNPIFGDIMHNVPRTNKSWDNGILKQSTVFGKSSTGNSLFPVSKTVNEYTHTSGKEIYAHMVKKKFDLICTGDITYECTQDDTNFTWETSICVADHIHVWSGYPICIAFGADIQTTIHYHPCYGETLPHTILRPDMLENLDITQYKHFEHRFHLTKTTTTTYDENGQNPIIDIVAHTYDGTYKNLKSTKMWRDVNANGSQDASEDYSYTAYSYIYDNIGGNAATVAEMIDRNMVSIPTKTLVHYNSTTGNLMDGNATEFTSIPRNGKTLIVPEISIETMGSSGLSPIHKIEDWNNEGRPIKTRVFKLDGTLDDNYTDITWNNELVDKIQNYSDLGVQETDYDYNANRQLTRITDHNGLVTEYEYDTVQRLWKVKTGKGTGDTHFRKVSTYNYYYKTLGAASNQVLTTVSFTDGSFPPQSTRIISDGLGREVSAQKDEYAPNYSDVTLYTNSYDDFGRLEQKTVLGKGTTVYAYESSPLNRVLEVTNLTGILTTKYGANSSNIVINGKTYPPQSLGLVTTINQKGNQSDSYQDFLGRDVQSVNYVTLVNSGLQPAITSKVFNDIGQLIKTIPPKGALYEYEYNSKGLVSKTSIPYQGTTEHYYDKLGRKVIDKDANDNHLGVVYDDLGRTIQTGDAPAPSTGLNIYYEPGTLALTKPHNTTTFKTVGGQPIDWIDNTATVDMSTLSTTPVYYMTTYSLYDNVGRALTISEQNHKGGIEVTNLTYNDADIITKTVLDHNTGNTAFGQQFSYAIEKTFDHGMRPDKVFITPPYSTNKQVISDLSYNDKDQVIKKRLHGDDNNAWQTIDYTYDQLGRITKINDAAQVLNTDCDKRELCDLSFRFHPLNSQGSTSIVIEDLFFMGDNGEESVILNTINYPFTLTTISKHQLISEIEAFIITQGYVFDDVEIDDNLKSLTISQTNARLTRIHYDQTVANKSIQNCCNAQPVGDLFSEFTFYESQGNNIERLIWTVPCGGLQTYYFQYDEMDRLLEANYYERPSLGTAWQNTQAYNMNATYDLIGNIKTMKRNGRVNGNVVAIDDLQYTYNSNSSKLVQVTDGVGPNFENHGLKGGGAIYLYDAKGNIIHDLGKHLEFSYNQYALPSRIHESFNTNNEILNKYLGTQARVQKKTHENGTTTIKDYIGSVEYLTKNGETRVEAIYHAEGRISLDQNNTPQFEYSIKDHLGNMRVNFTDKNKDGIISKSDIIQENHFYPFGMNMEGEWVQTYGKENKYQYNGKELDSELGLNWNNYGARFYDPALGRFTNIDPLAADFVNWSPYCYTLNDPISLVDPDGRSPKKGTPYDAAESFWNFFSSPNFDGMYAQDPTDFIENDGHLYYLGSETDNPLLVGKTSLFLGGDQKSGTRVNGFRDVLSEATDFDVSVEGGYVTKEGAGVSNYIGGKIEFTEGEVSPVAKKSISTPISPSHKISVTMGTSNQVKLSKTLNKGGQTMDVMGGETGAKHSQNAYVAVSKSKVKVGVDAKGEVLFGGKGVYAKGDANFSLSFQRLWDHFKNEVNKNGGHPLIPSNQ